MALTIRRFAAPFYHVPLVLLLSSCGFQPIHSQSYRASQVADLSAFEVVVSGTDITPEEGGKNTNIPRRYSELLKAELLDRASPSGASSEKKYRLEVTFTEAESGQFVNPDGTASRGDLVYDSRYRILRLNTMKEVTKGGIQRTSSYNVAPSADYASYVSIEDARRRGMIELAQDYKLRLAALMPMLNDPNSLLNNPPKKKENPIESEDDWAPHINPGMNDETLRPRL